MAVCLPKEYRDKIKNAFVGGELTIERLYKMSDAERNSIFRRYAGDNASLINASFEAAMLSSQKAAFVNWIKKNTTFSDPVRKDMISRIERNKKLLSPDEMNRFMDDLVEQKLGYRVSDVEAKNIMEMSETMENFKNKITPDMPRNAVERLQYGLALQQFNRYVGKLKLAATSLKFKEMLLPKNYWNDIVQLAGITKSLVASVDNSFIGRQGIKVLFTNPKIWGQTAIKSIELFGKELVAKAPEGFFGERPDALIDGIKANIYGDPYFLDGHYRAAKNGYGLEVLREEVFPTSLPERIPVLGRVFKASETAFQGSALYMRHKLANAVIKNAEMNGVDMLDPRQATAHGKVVSSITGRGELGKLGVAGKEINAIMFSIRFLKSNFDTLTAHLFDKDFTPEARKLAGNNILKISSSLTALLAVADILGADVEWNPQSSRFGQICYDNHCFDPTGGMRGLITLGSRIVPTYHNGEWGLWRISAQTGKWIKIGGDKYGEQTALDTFEQFFEGKLSPAAGVVRDYLKQQTFEGKKPTFVDSFLGLITPISAEMLVDELKKGNDDILIAMLAEGFGISTTQTTMTGSGKKWQMLKDKIDTKTYNDALKIVTSKFNERAEKLKKSSRWQKMNNDERSKELDKMRKEETERIFSKYGIK